jgi:hypothetical protein
MEDDNQDMNEFRQEWYDLSAQAFEEGFGDEPEWSAALLISKNPAWVEKTKSDVPKKFRQTYGFGEGIVRLSKQAFINI